MKPYYEQDGITLYHGDCRDLLPLLAVSPRLLITDPPYRSLDIDVIRGTTTRLVGGTKGRGGDRISNGDWFVTLSDDEIESVISGCVARLPTDGAAYIFADVKTGLGLFSRLEARNVLVWDKLRLGMGYSWRRMHEWIAYVPCSGHKLRSDSYGDIIRVAGVDDKAHPTEKPVGVITPLLLNSSDLDDLVLDPFAGVGSTLVAAKLNGRRAVGIEIHEPYCKIAASRLAQGVLFGIGGGA